MILARKMNNNNNKKRETRSFEHATSSICHLQFMMRNKIVINHPARESEKKWLVWIFKKRES